MTNKVSTAVMEWAKSWVAGWTKSRFFERNMHQMTRRGEVKGMPIVTNREGYVDASFVGGTDHVEFVQDTVGGMVTGNTETGMTVTYDDTGGKLNFTLNQVDHGSLAGLSDDDHTQYVHEDDGTYRVFMADIADIGSLQTVTIDITSPSHTRRFITHIDLVLGRSGNNNVYGLMNMTVLWQTNGSGTAGTVHSHEYSFVMSGTATGASATAITDGIRITFDSSAFGNTLNDNRVRIQSVGQNADTLSHTVSIT